MSPEPVARNSALDRLPTEIIRSSALGVDVLSSPEVLAVKPEPVGANRWRDRLATQINHSPAHGVDVPRLARGAGREA